MCGRFNVLQTPGLEALLQSLGCHGRPAQRSNIAPTESVPLIRAAGGRVELVEAHWWLTPHWAKERSQKYAMFNARAESAANSPAFRKPFARQRGIVPMSSFIEWRREGSERQPWLISTDQDALAVAALWDLWPGEDPPLLSCTLMTTEAAETFRPWHARMPVILDGDEQWRWLDNDRPIDSSDPIFAPVLKLPMHLAPVGRSVGNARNKDPQAMQAVGETVELEPGP
ncbi:MAG: SOS response-associated peptidase [Halieaceae bacterium]|nr:SOS response-associated peptidase [Halieaceae bacterium]